MAHAAVKHPREWKRAVASRSDRFISWVSEHILASAGMFYMALVLPLAVLPASDSVKLFLAVVSGSWIQWWALPALQRSQMKADEERSLKNQADHETLTYLAARADELLAQAARLESILLHPSNQGSLND